MTFKAKETAGNISPASDAIVVTTSGYIAGNPGFLTVLTTILLPIGIQEALV